MNFIMIGLLCREELDRLRVPLNMYLVVIVIIVFLNIITIITIIF